MATVLLPCEFEEWWEDKRLFMLLSNMRSVKDLDTLICSHTREGSEHTILSRRLKELRGLVMFLKNFCTDKEQNIHASVTLPFIARSASKLDELVPESGIPFLVQQEAAALVLGRKLVMSLIANAFLCTFPDSQYQRIESFNFNQIFAVFSDQSEERRQKSQAAKLKCVLCYFQRAAEERCDLSGVITLRRQVVLKEDLPSLDAWAYSQSPLCNIQVDEGNIIESSGSHTLQVDFANRRIGGGVLRSGCLQEEIKFCLFPELLVSKLIMDHMDDNEAITVTGAERFSAYTGYGGTFEFAGEYEDASERDVFGNFLTSTVAIDAHPFRDGPEKQYAPEFILRELNKAYAGYLCTQDRGDISTELLALNMEGPSMAYIAENYPHHHPDNSTSGFDDSALGNLNSSSQPNTALSSRFTTSNLSTPDYAAPPLSPIKEMNEASLLTTITDSILKVGVREAVKKETSDSSAPKPKGGEFVDEFASTLTSSLFSEVRSEAPQERDQLPNDNHAVDQFASTVTNSLFGGILSKTKPSEVSSDKGDLAATPTTSVKPGHQSTPADSDVETLTSSLASSIVKSSLESSKNESLDTKEDTAVNEADAGELAKSIISDAFSSLKSVPTPEALPAKTSCEPTSSFSQALSSFTDSVTSSIVADACSIAQSSSGKASGHPAIFIQVERRGSAGGINESPRSSRSSSLTGQSITVHEFTDDLAETLVRDGLSIAQYTSQSQDLPAQMDMEGAREKPVTQPLTEAVKGQSTVAMKSSPLDERPTSLPELDRPTASKKPKKPLMFSRQELAIVAARISAKHSSLSEQGEHSDSEASHSSQINMRLLTPSSSRQSMGYAWSTASTRDIESRPDSPTDLDRLALSLSTDPDDYSHLYSKILVSDAILSVSGERPKHLRQSYICDDDDGALNMTSLPNESKIDTFLSRLDQAEALSQGSADESDTMTRFIPNLQQKLKTMLLRPIATGNWGCGAFKGNPQLKSMLQLVVASSCGRPQVIYYTHENKDMIHLEKVCAHLQSKKCTAGQLCGALLEYSQRSAEERADTDLFTVLMNM